MAKPTLAFDGRVIEIFFDSLDSSSRRIHVSHIRSINLAQVGRGKEPYQLQINGEYMVVAVDVSEAAVAQVAEVVTAVQHAKNSWPPPTR